MARNVAHLFGGEPSPASDMSNRYSISVFQGHSNTGGKKHEAIRKAVAPNPWFRNAGICDVSCPPENATGAGAAPVNIVNSIPLSVTGMVGVNNFPATLTGASVPVTGTVGLSGNSAAAPLLVRDVDNPARHPYHDSSGSQCVEVTTCFVSFVVPANKLLVIESVAVESDVPTGQKVEVHIDSSFGLPVDFQGTFTSFDTYLGAFSGRLYKNPGATINVRADRNSTTSFFNLGADISGYLVDCGAGSGCPLP